MAEWILETERLRLRRIEPGDAQLQFGLLNTPAIMHHLGGPLSLEAIEQKHRKSMDLHEREGFSFLFLIVVILFGTLYLAAAQRMIRRYQ